jgi:hypothetical protein
MQIINSKFEYLLSPRIIVMGDYINKEYFDCINNKKDEIELAWEREQEKRNKKLFNGNILNLAIIEQQDANNLILKCHPIEYKHYLAQRAGIDLGITPLAVSGIVFYRENNSKIFYVGKRSEVVTQYPGYYEFIPSGSIDANDLIPNQPVDFSKQLIIELKEELGVSLEKIKSYKAFCLVYDETDNVYDIGIEIEVIKDQFKTDETEYSAVQRIPLSSIGKFVKGENVVNTSRKLFEAWCSTR